MKKKTRVIAGSALLLAVLAFLGFGYWYMVKCEGLWEGEPLEVRMARVVGAIKDILEADVAFMSVTLGPRNPAHYEALSQCADWIRKRWESQGYQVKDQTFLVEGKECSNLEIEIPGRKAPSEIVIVAAQYDSLPDSPAANNNATGVAVLLKLSDLLRGYGPDRTLRLVSFVTEEDPYFGTEMMGSFRYARRCRDLGEDIRAMLSLDAIGYYTDAPDSQKLPLPFSLFYPDRGNFLAFIGDFRSRGSMLVATRGFKKGSSFPIQAGLAPQWVKGAGWSDHSSFWRFGYPGIMVTDTGGFRSPWHTTNQDTMEKLDFVALSRITMGMHSSIIELSKAEE